MKKILLLLFVFINVYSYSQTYTIDQGGNIATCSGNFYDTGGNGSNYSDNENEVITFCSNNSTCINVTFNSFNLDSSDFLYIYNGPNTASQLIATLTGNTLPTNYSSFFGCLTFQFVSNDTITSSGWAATLNCSTCSFSGGGNGTLTPIYDNEACGLNFTQVSQKVTTRYATPAGTGVPSTLNLTGLPAPGTCWSVEKALLYWTESSNSNGAVTATVTNPMSSVSNYNVSPVGVGIDKCWGTSFTTNYRIDVTADITGNGNYTVNISSGSWNVDGLTMIVIYRDLTAPYTGRLMINDGLMANSSGAPSFVAINNINACATSTSGTAFLLVGDMQDNIAPPTHSTTLNGAALTFPNLFWNYDQTPTTVTAGQATAQFGTAPSGGGDCYSVVAAGLYYQTTCLTCPSNAFSVPISQTIQTCTGGDIVANPGGGAVPYSYIWNTGGTTQGLNGLGPATYTVTVTDNIGCQATSSITVNVAPPLTNTPTIANISCNNGNNGSISVITNGGSPGYTYSWNTGGTTNSLSNLGPGNYILTTTDNAGCMRVDTFVVSTPSPLIVTLSSYNISCNGSNDGSLQSSVSGGTAPYIYSWSNGATTDSIFNLNSGSYTVIVTDNSGCIDSSTFIITEPQVFTASLTGNNLLCNNDNSGSITTSINGGTLPYAILWNTGATTNNISSLSIGTYYVDITDNNGCVTSDTIILIEPPLLNDSIMAIDVLCNSDATGNINLFPYGGTPGYTYLWNTGAFSQNLTNITAGIYFVTITDSNNCTVTDTTTINEPIALSYSSITNPTCKNTCLGDVLLTYSGGTSPYQLIWNTGDSNITFLDSLCNDNYFFTLTDSNNCMLSDTIQINLLSQINANFTFSPDSGVIPVQVSFTDNSSGGIVGWSWNFGDNNSSTMQNPINTYTNEGLYAVTLIVTDSLGCTDTITIEITVLPESSIVIPNVFTPNGDGINDFFTVKSGFLKSIEGAIYNRWGQLLYQWNNLKGSWDGRTLSGTKVPDGIYFYIITIEDLKGKETLFKGTITLIR